MALARLLVMMLAVLTLVYICLWFYARAARKEALEKTWDENAGPGDRDGFVQAKLAEYAVSLRRWLIIGVYILPLSAFSIYLYLSNTT